MVHSNKYPTILRLQGDIIAPYSVEAVTGDEGDSYRYKEYRVRDIGQSFTDNDHRMAIVDTLNSELSAYIYSRYDQGTQASFIALSVQSEQAKAATQPVWDWIKAVLQYYYGVKEQLLSRADFANVAWDYSQFDGADPSVALVDLVS